MPVRRNRKSRRRARSSSAVDSFSNNISLNDGPSYLGQQRFMVTMPTQTTLTPTIVTTGVIADTFTSFDSIINGFTARFGSTFDEYRILRITALIRPVSNASGISMFWFDEQDTSTAPTLNASQERYALALSNSNANSASFKQMTWNAKDLVDLGYSPLGFTSSPVAFKVYTDAANYGSPITVTNLWAISFMCMFEFRGIHST